MPDLHLLLQDNDDGTPVAQADLPEEEAIRLLAEAEITAASLVPWGSNYTFAVALEPEDEDARGHLAIYKPRRGERPLWDFPTGTLSYRERASYLLSRRLGWNLVPPTVLRDGPHGSGSVQLYIEPHPDHEDDHRFWGQRRIEIERMALFDHIANNADRKLAHCLISASGRLWGIDHGLTFNIEPKLRTVLWQYNDVPIDPLLLEDLVGLTDEEDAMRAELGELLGREELDAFFARVEALVAVGVFPELDPYRNIPYGWW
ncbi:MAG: hypothetical protein QM589_08630 [Thermomicrobiales bacterium]